MESQHHAAMLHQLRLDETGMSDPPIEVGSLFSIYPCLGPDQLDGWKEEGQLCPRPAKYPPEENEEAQDMVLSSLMEHTRHLVPLILEYSVHPDERGDVLRRVQTALLSSMVQEIIYPSARTDES